ncbi:MAG TPA: hypothetical protein VEL75_01295 [Candidatus Methylomirabilis sp.]|nr:hypothetical protein [Candidatus Methylomirabilis sp.]
MSDADRTSEQIRAAVHRLEGVSPAEASLEEVVDVLVGDPLPRIC